MEVIIGRAEKNDAKALKKIYRDAYSENEKLGLPASASNVAENEIQEWINQTILITAKDMENNNIVATVRFKYNEEWQCYVLSRLAVKSSLKGKGIATKLIKYGESLLFSMEEKVIRLTVAQPHPYLPKMYQKYGYAIVGKRPLESLPYDEYIMEKELI
ncbi:GNAT family N-acetyltransferase [Sutcliffiella rhizosphaerae]|uniref:N-acetyltransferase domain-containing protein n=1 Tax=Sutcliffiella rhizosphaerae TaxID=2880967 RepID=A0ABM8YTP5_9BACI|nr:GNAT family N-acetyltransferase [Sutcliffiella rhizosphaerae]CAG9623337.1 hypothetical protein BACCIP111883_04138 [Sutcliffiella rhizosphaerae]